MEKTTYYKVTILANPEGFSDARNPFFTFSRDEKQKMYDFIDVIVEKGEEVMIELQCEEES